MQDDHSGPFVDSGPLVTVRGRAAVFWHALTPPQRRLMGFAALTGATGLFHVLVWLAHGAPSLVGPVTWRKPIVFGLSIAVVTTSLAWVIGMLPDSRGLRRTTTAFIVCLTLELALIDMQQWRGVGSHFNNATVVDTLVFAAMGLLILGAAIISAIWTWQLCRPDVSRAHATKANTGSGTANGPERLLAARAGMLLLGAGNLIGIGLSVWGSAIVRQTGAPPSPIGPLADLKLAHAIALHGLQVLPIAALTLRRLAGGSTRALSLTRLAMAAYVGLLVFALSQVSAMSSPLAPLLGALTFVSCLALTSDRPRARRRQRVVNTDSSSASSPVRS